MGAVTYTKNWTPQVKWEGLNLHVENLLPGILSTVLIFMLLPPPVANTFKAGIPPSLLTNEFLSASCFLAAAYILGVLCVALSRLILDRLSEMLPRPLLLRALSRGSLKGMALRAVNADYRRSLAIALHSSNHAIVDEVLNRRQRGRLARTSLVPALLFAIVATADMGLVPRLLWILAVLVALLFTYAYIEVTVYEECQLEVQHAGHP